ncbi:hypothetical protein Cgig2_031293 [Carnegiea gigantea]|uniref:RING-type E3 ubiquitin transferase n=1 Tax=Carnegiea gigantea TaxID=171969 RepID=A0A9Q1KM53_9CARY|nr:hypothetical protein Cgig2_031293 [Carnegiea gigantea]
MASESGTTTPAPEMQSTPNSSHRTFSIFIPFFFGFTTGDPGQNSGYPDENSANNLSPDGQNQVQRDRLMLINPLTQGVVVLEGTAPDLNTLFRTLAEKEGPPPAAKSAIEAMASVEIGKGDDGNCAICLEEWVSGMIVKEMPCKHRFHGGCIEKWLGMHGSCPVCRYAMPAEEEEREKKGEEREEEGERRREIWVSFSFGGMRRTEEETESGDQWGSNSGDESGSTRGDGDQGEVQGGESVDGSGSNSGARVDESGSMEDID